MIDALWSAIWNFHFEGNLEAALRCALECWKLAPWRFRYLKVTLGTGLRYLMSGRRQDATYNYFRPDGKKFLSLSIPSTPGET
jgi:hypothetical protein